MKMLSLAFATFRPFKASIFPSLYNCRKCVNLQTITIRKSGTSNQTVLDINTNVVKDVLLYSIEGAKHIRLLNFFAVGQFLFWNYLAETVFTTFKDTSIATNPNGPWYTRFNLGTDVMRYSLTALCLVMGNGLLAVAYMYTSRSIKYIVLRKGGSNVVLATYTPIGGERIITVPVNHISAQESRAAAKVAIPIKVKGKSLFYLLDVAGKFGNRRLFDATVGLRRTFTTKK